MLFSWAVEGGTHRISRSRISRSPNVPLTYRDCLCTILIDWLLLCVRPPPSTLPRYCCPASAVPGFLFVVLRSVLCLAARLTYYLLSLNNSRLLEDRAIVVRSSLEDRAIEQLCDDCVMIDLTIHETPVPPHPSFDQRGDRGGGSTHVGGST